MRSRPLRHAAAAGLLALGAAGCGSATHSTSTAVKGTPAAFHSEDANPVAVPPVSDAALRSGDAAHRISETITAFYRGAWEGQPQVACDQFSAFGVQGFMQAAKTAFPSAIGPATTCAHAMSIYGAALGDSAQNAEAADPQFSTAPLDHVTSAAITVSGNRAEAIAPTNIVTLINPERFELVRQGAYWKIDSSHSLNKSNLPAILARARATGLLRAKRGG